MSENTENTAGEEVQEPKVEPKTETKAEPKAEVETKTEIKTEATSAPATEEKKAEPPRSDRPAGGYGNRDNRDSGDRGGYRRDRFSSDNKRKFIFKRKFCRFCKDPGIAIDYKNVDLLTRYTKSHGKILPRRFSGNCAKHQRFIARAIKRSRAIALLPYVAS